MPKIVEMKLSSCGLEFVDIRKNCDCGIAELRLRSNISLQSCGIAIAEVLFSTELRLRTQKKLRVPTSADILEFVICFLVSTSFPLYFLRILCIFLDLCRPSEASAWYYAIPGGDPPKD
jgi:hypothetical protein